MIDDQLVTKVMLLWKAGHDTAAIAVILKTDEPTIVRALQIGRDRDLKRYNQ